MSQYGRKCWFVANRQRPPLGGRHGYEYSTDFTGLRSIFRPLVRYDLGRLVRGAAAGSKRSLRVKAGQVASSMLERGLDRR
jgi:hypothetical protein